jgi:hypothetical protein
MSPRTVFYKSELGEDVPWVGLVLILGKWMLDLAKGGRPLRETRQQLG